MLTDYRAVYREGEVDYSIGYLLADNPYPVESDAYVGWNDGWHDMLYHRAVQTNSEDE